MCKIYGHMRVSSVDQREDRQLIDLLQYGIPREDIYMDKLSGKNFDRPGYQKLRKRLRDGDLLVLKSLDRLGRSYRDILDEWRYLTKKKNVDILILDMPLLDTRRDRDLIGTLITDIVLQLLSYVAEVERNNIRQRQAEGIAAAKQRGVKFGRPALQIPEEFSCVYRAWKAKELTPPQAMDRLGLTAGQFYWMAKVYASRQSQKDSHLDTSEQEGVK